MKTIYQISRIMIKSISLLAIFLSLPGNLFLSAFAANYYRQSPVAGTQTDFRVLQLIDISTGKTIASSSVHIISNNGIRCRKAPCPTNPEEWSGKSDQYGRVQVPSFVIQADTYIETAIYEGRIPYSVRNAGKEVLPVRLSKQRGNAQSLNKRSALTLTNRTDEPVEHQRLVKVLQQTGGFAAMAQEKTPNTGIRNLPVSQVVKAGDENRIRKFICKQQINDLTIFQLSTGRFEFQFRTICPTHVTIEFSEQPPVSLNPPRFKKVPYDPNKPLVPTITTGLIGERTEHNLIASLGADRKVDYYIITVQDASGNPIYKAGSLTLDSVRDFRKRIKKYPQ